MPSTIPFDPSLVLGNLINLDKINGLKAIAEEQKPADDAQDALNALILNKRKLDMTYQEMVNMGVSVSDLTSFEQMIEKLKGDIATHAAKYGDEVMKSAGKVESTKDSQDQKQINEAPESPIDWNKSSIKKMPLSSDTMNVDVQYIRNETEVDSNEAHASAVALAVSGSVGSIFGSSVTARAAHSAKSSTLHQTSQHEIVGTLVITATCTHKIADVFAPFIMDPDKAIDAWNLSYPQSTLDTTSEAELKKALAVKADEKDPKLYLLSGQTMGSSFVGMVHIIQAQTTDSTQSESARTSAAAVEAKASGLFTYYSGKFGISSDSSKKLQDLLSTNDMTSHCCLVTMGLIPSLKSNEVGTTIKTLQPDAKEVMDQLSEIQNATDGEVTSPDDKAKAARTGQNFIELQNSYLKNSVSSVIESEVTQNKVIDTNSLMTAFDDFVKKAAADDACGVPINFFVKEITKEEIAKAYLKKYSPLPNWQLSSDDDSSSAEKSS